MAKILLGYQYDNAWYPPGWYLEQAFKALGHEVTHDVERGIDLVLCLPPTAGFRVSGVPTFYWEIDATRKKAREDMGTYDRIFVDNKERKHYPLATFLPVAADLDFFQPHGEPIYDVMHLGAYGKNDQYAGYTQRETIMQLIASKGYKTFSGNGYYKQEYPKKLSESRMFLNITGLGELNMHYFEYMAMGAMIYKENRRYLDIATPDEHYISYRKKGELLQKLEWYTSNPKRITKVARAGREHLAQHHTYKHRAQTILKYL